LWILAFCQLLLWSWPAESAAINVAHVPILKSQGEQQIDGSYFFSYEAADGTYREEVGIVKKSELRHADDELEVSGIYGFIDTSGQKVEVSYTADGNNGFLPHIRY
ncbi:hypothetical protein KR018_007748, partial [Drosophila ironensis]